jgi:hypothetical protein
MQSQDEVWQVREICFKWLSETYGQNWAWGDMAEEASERFRFQGIPGVADYFGRWLEYNNLQVIELCDRIKGEGLDGKAEVGYDL